MPNSVEISVLFAGPQGTRALNQSAAGENSLLHQHSLTNEENGYIYFEHAQSEVTTLK